MIKRGRRSRSRTAEARRDSRMVPGGALTPLGEATVKAKIADLEVVGASAAAETIRRALPDGLAASTPLSWRARRRSSTRWPRRAQLADGAGAPVRRVARQRWPRLLPRTLLRPSTKRTASLLATRWAVQCLRPLRERRPLRLLGHLPSHPQGDSSPGQHPRPRLALDRLIVQFPPRPPTFRPQRARRARRRRLRAGARMVAARSGRPLHLEGQGRGIG